MTVTEAAAGLDPRVRAGQVVCPFPVTPHLGQDTQRATQAFCRASWNCQAAVRSSSGPRLSSRASSTNCTAATHGAVEYARLLMYRDALPTEIASRQHERRSTR